MKVAVIDYGISNVKSICNALSFMQIEAFLTKDRSQILNADAVILPGVGAFQQGMKNLETYNLIGIINEFVETGKPFIGICLGMQMLLDESEEFGFTKGLGLIKGKVIKMPIDDENCEKLPHVSWKTIYEPENLKWENTLLKNINKANSFYFVHSFIAKPQNENDILATSKFGDYEFCAAIKHENIYGFQFHPEKSSKFGLEILNNLK